VKIAWGPYTPDLAPHLNDGLTAISNAYPRGNGYAPVGAFTAVTPALPADCLGAGSFVSPQGISVIIAGTATNLYRGFAGSWLSLSAGYSLQDGQRWRFAQFGGLAIATSGADAMQKIDLETGIVAPLGGSPPTARMLAGVADFLVAGVVNGAVNKVRWSGINNAEFWTIGARQSDEQTLPDGGSVNGIIGGEYGLILQRGCVRRMSYVGGNTIFRFDKIASTLGCVTVHSVAQHGDRGFWLSDNGFMMSVAGQITPIGFEKVDRTFLAQYDVRSWPSMSAAIDQATSTVCWSMADKCWIYNWVLEKWSIIDLAAQIVFPGFTPTLSIDEQDSTVGSLDDNIDGSGLLSFDDPRFKGGDPRFYVISSARTLGTLSGTNMAASFTTADREVVSEADTRVKSCRPMTDAVAGLTLTLKTKQRLGDTPTTTTTSSLQTTGEMPIRARGRFVRASMAHAAASAWSYSQGCDFRAMRGGRR
jgi:hypothetical protein